MNRYFVNLIVCIFCLIFINLVFVLPIQANTEFVLSAQTYHVDLSDNESVQVGKMPIYLSHSGTTLDSINLRTLSPEIAGKLSPLNIAFTLNATSNLSRQSLSLNGTMIIVDYSDLPYQKWGAYFTDRLIIAEGTQCDLESGICLNWHNLPTENDLSQQTLSTDLSSRSAQSDTIYSVSTRLNSAYGDYSLTPFSTVSHYQVDLNSGAMTTNYQISVPPARSGTAPSIKLTYNSGIVDGMHNNKNNQSSPIGLGWSLEGGSITRHLKKCSTNNLNLCIDQDSSTEMRHEFSLTLNGVSSRLIHESGNIYRLQNDAYWKIEKHEASAQHMDGEYWIVTTPEGTQYRFGENTLLQNSVFYVPVNACNGLCDKAWQWNLDRVIDANQNETIYYYETETNYYKQNGTTTLAPYIRAGQLNRIEYTAQVGETPTARVRFIEAGRCLEHFDNFDDCALDDTHPDVPTEYNCSETDVACSLSQPSFWSRKRIRAVETQILVETEILNDSTWETVVYYEFEQGFDHQDGTDLGGERPLWLKSITQGELPPVTYEPIWLNNRHDVAGGVSAFTMPRIQKITNELGGVLDVDYSQSHPAASNSCSGPDNSNIHLGLDCFVTALGDGEAYWNKWKVMETNRYNDYSVAYDLNTVETLRYDYSPPAWHFNTAPPEIGSRHWNDYRGSDIVTVTVSSGAYTEHRFYRGMKDDRTNATNDNNYSASIELSDGSTRSDHHWLAGRPVEVSAYDSDDIRLSHTLYRYSAITTTNHTDVYAPYNANAHFVGLFDVRQTADDIKTTRNQYQYDQYGNVITEYQYGDLSTTVDDRHIVTTYNYDIAKYIVSKPESQTLRQGTTLNSGEIGAKTLYGYDDNGNLISEKRYSDLYTPLETTYFYDNYGRILTVTDPKNQTITTTYHPQYGYVDSVTNAKGQMTSYIVEPKWGVVSQTVDANGLVVEQDYDELGRLIEVRLPDQVTGIISPSLTYEYTIDWNKQNPPMAKINKLDKLEDNPLDNKYLSEWVYSDGFGREIQRQTVSPNGGQLTAISQRYDERGLLSHQSTTYELGGVAGIQYRQLDWDMLEGHSRYQYDGLGRVKRTGWYSESTELWASQATYNGWQTTLTDAKGHETTQTQDGFGQLVQVRDALNQATTYQYDLSGDLTFVTDSANNQTIMRYDWLGRKTEMTDPDMGTWYYKYDGVGNLIAQIDARGTATNHYYDSLNRLIGKTYQENVTNPATYQPYNTPYHTVSYFYDEVGYGNSIGQLTRVLDESGGQAYFYDDERGRLSSEVRWYPDTRSYTQEYTYDIADRIVDTTYPDGEVVSNRYNAQGRPDHLSTTVSVNDKNVYVNWAKYNGRGQITDLYYNNGDSPTPATQILYGYHSAEHQFQLHTISTTRSNSPFVKQAYSDYDHLGNLKESTFVYQGVMTQTAQYSYDDLSRLIGISGFNNDSYDYDAIGNVLTMTGRSYVYDIDHPHAVSSIGSEASYFYDANGNMTTRTESGVTYQQEFDTENRLTRVDKPDSSYLLMHYDDAGQRKRVDSYNSVNQLTETTFYPFPTYEHQIVYDNTQPSSTFNALTDTNFGFLALNLGIDIDTLYENLGVYDPPPPPTVVSQVNVTFAKHLSPLILLCAVFCLLWVTIRYRKSGLLLLLLLAASTTSVAIPTLEAQATSERERLNYFFNGQVIGVRTKVDGAVGEVEYLHHDRLGSTILMSTQDGVVIPQSTTRYKPFGGYHTAPTNDNEIGFTGHRHNDDIGLIYMNARYYSPFSGRFISADTLVPNPSNPQSLNRYSYVYNNPLNGTDPSGHAPSFTGPSICIVCMIDLSVEIEDVGRLISTERYLPFRGHGRLVTAFKFGLNVEGYGMIDISHATGSFDISEQIVSKMQNNENPFQIQWQAITKEYSFDHNVFQDTEAFNSRAYDIFRQFSEEFENYQLNKGLPTSISAYSPEDLASNYIGFYAYVYHRGMGKSEAIAHTIRLLSNENNPTLAISLPIPARRNYEWSFVDCGLFSCSSIEWPQSLQSTSMRGD